MRRLFGLGLLCLLAATAGCASVLGPEPVDRAAIGANATYDWTTTCGNAACNASINVTGGEYRAVYNVAADTDGNPREFAVNRRDGLGRERPLDVSALKFRYPNESAVPSGERDGDRVVAIEPANVTNTRERTVITLPAAAGQLAFTAPADAKRFATRTFVQGTYRVVIPPDMRVDVVPLARVTPSGYTTETIDGRVHLTWEDVRGSSLVVRYYLARDLYIFAGGTALLVLVAGVGVAYYLRQIRELERRREEVGLDVDVHPEDFDDGPPPGMG
jgi:hypothetical protein